MNDLPVRAKHLLNALDGWILNDALTPPHYVQREIDALTEALRVAAGETP